MKSLSEQKLSDSLEALYSVFRGYPFRSGMPCCVPHCFSKEEINALNKPLRSLSGTELSSFTWGLLLTCGDTEDFKHFLPRLFELTLENTSHFCDTEIVLGKLGRADFHTWPPEEQKAVLEFLRCWWQVILETLPEHRHSSLSEVLTGLSCANLDLQLFLDMWLNSTTLIASLHLTDFIEDSGAKLRLGKSFNAFLEPEHLPIINQWLFRDETQQYLEQAFFSYSDSVEAARISSAVDILASLRKLSV